jgi:hypothetical protein
LAQARSGVAFRAKLAMVMSLFGKNDYQLFNSAGVPSPDRMRAASSYSELGIVETAECARRLAGDGVRDIYTALIMKKSRPSRRLKVLAWKYSPQRVCTAVTLFAAIL